MANRNPSPDTRFKPDDPRRWRGGSPSLPKGFKEACQLHAWEHLDRVVEIMKHGPPALQLRAWQLLADRGFGLPKAQVDVTSDGEKIATPVVYAQPPSQTPEEWMERHAPKDNENKH